MTFEKRLKEMKNELGYLGEEHFSRGNMKSTRAESDV